MVSIVTFDIEKLSPPTLFSYFKIALAILDPCNSEFQNQLVNFYKEVSWDSDKNGMKFIDLWNLQIILTLVSLPNYKHFFHLFIYLVSFHNFFSFQSISFTFLLLNLFLSTLFFLMLFVNGIIFLILFSDYSLQVCKNRIQFCTLILDPSILLNQFHSSNSFLVDSSGFSICKIMLSENREDFQMTQSFLLLSFKSGCLLFLFLA